MPRSERTAFAPQLPLFIGLVLIWMLLWGEFTLLSLITGIVLAFLVSWFFYLPAVRLGDRINPWYCAVYLGRLLYDIAHASIAITWSAFSPAYRPGNAIVGVNLRTRNDLILTLVAVSLSIVPGSIVVDVNRVNSTLYLHVFNVNDHAGVEKMRREALNTEYRIVKAIGSRADLKRLRTLLEFEKAEPAERES